MSDINGIHYEISSPVQNLDDGYYYQRVRQVDDQGNLVGIGEQVLRSAQPGSIDGLVGHPLDVLTVGLLLKTLDKRCSGVSLKMGE